MVRLGWYGLNIDTLEAVVHGKSSLSVAYRST